MCVEGKISHTCYTFKIYTICYNHSSIKRISALILDSALFTGIKIYVMCRGNTCDGQ